MEHSPARLADTRGWLLKARMDIRAAEVDLNAEPPLSGDALFHCQQAVEKAFKALLTWHDLPFRKTHDLGELGLAVRSLAPELETLLRTAAPLSEYAWRYRYPAVEDEEPEMPEAEDALDLARQVLTAICTRLPAELQP